MPKPAARQRASGGTRGAVGLERSLAFTSNLSKRQLHLHNQPVPSRVLVQAISMVTELLALVS